MVCWMMPHFFQETFSQELGKHTCQDILAPAGSHPLYQDIHAKGNLVIGPGQCNQKGIADLAHSNPDSFFPVASFALFELCNIWCGSIVIQPQNCFHTVVLILCRRW